MSWCAEFEFRVTHPGHEVGLECSAGKLLAGRGEVVAAGQLDRADRELCNGGGGAGGYCSRAARAPPTPRDRQLKAAAAAAAAAAAGVVGRTPAAPQEPITFAAHVPTCTPVLRRSRDEGRRAGGQKGGHAVMRIEGSCTGKVFDQLLSSDSP